MISSIAGKVGAPLRTGYCGAKHAVVGYFDALRTEVETAYGIQVSVILPGPVRTAIATNALAADGSRRGHSEELIDNGMDPDAAAHIMLDGLAGKPPRSVAVAQDATNAGVPPMNGSVTGTIHPMPAPELRPGITLDVEP